MFGDTHSPSSLSPDELDEYLEKGWYRMGQTIFTCNFLHFNRQFYSAVWLRLRLLDYQEESTFKKLKKLNVSFEVRIQAANITAEKEALFQLYKTGIKFETSSSLQSLLFGDSALNIYDTKEVCIYHQEKLIAVGYFDLGTHTAAGIVSFYDPAYKKHSLGKYLIYHKIAFCIQEGKSFFYPGYFAPHYPMFDYKLAIGKPAIEFLSLYSNQWEPLAKFNSLPSPLEKMEHYLAVMQVYLFHKGIKTIRLKYEFYNANSIPHLQSLALFDYPEFIFVFSPNHQGFNPVLVYDVVENQYKLLKCNSMYHDENYLSTDNHFGSHLMKVQEILFVGEDKKLMLDLFLPAEG
jgi:arginine-tRNA-protein transferase